MPTYTFIDTTDNEKEVEIACTIAEMEQWEKDHPHMKRVYNKMNIVDPVNIGVKRPPIDFQRHVLGKVKQMPGSNAGAIEKRWSIPKEV